MTLIDEALGATLVGAAVATMLFGLALAQLYNLFVSDYRSVRMIKLLAAAVGLLDTTHTVFLWAWMYDIIVSNYGNIMAMNTVSGLLAACFMSFFTLGGVVQAYFTYRLWGLSGHLWLAASLWSLELVNYGIHTSIVVFATRSNGYLDFMERYNWLVYAAMSSAVAISSSNTILLCWYLAKMDSGLPRTHKVVKKLILFTCETGGLQAGMALITAALWFAKPSASFWVASYMVDAKLYSNSLLATLNSRSHFRAALEAPLSVHLPPLSRSPNTSGRDGLSPNHAEARFSSLCFAERGDGVVDSGISVPKSQDLHTRHDPDFELNVEGASAGSTLHRASLDGQFNLGFSREDDVEPSTSLPEDTPA